MNVITSLLVFLFALSTAACGRTPNRAVCCVSQADCDALGVDEPVRNCLDGMICQDNACVPPVCEVDIDCSTDTPFCSDGECVGCRDSKDCSGPSPVCDDLTATCRACAMDTDCASNACDFANGTCIPAEAVWYASPDGNAAAPCSQESPCSLTTAIAAANSARPTVRMLPGAYTVSVTIESTVALHGDGAALLAPGTGLLVKDAANATVFGLSITKQGGATAQDRLGVYCLSSTTATPKLRLERVTIETQNDAEPLALNQCIMSAIGSTFRGPSLTTAGYLVLVGTGGTASFERSRLEGGGGVAAAGGQITATNSILVRLGGPPADGGVLAVGGGSVSVAYSTFYDSALACGVGDAASCSSAARTGVCIENSLILRSSGTDAINGDRCRCDYCMVTPQQAAVTGSNNTFNAFLAMRDPMGGDFHLVSGSDAIDAAHPSITGTPDFDGTSRPQGPRSDVGAFEFKK